MDLMLVHYYKLNMKPLKSISEPSEDFKEVYEFLKKQEDKAFRRYKNLSWYIEERQHTEKWLREEFLKIGGLPKRATPVYFALGESKYLKECYGENVGTIQIPLKDILATDVSFTLKDSMAIQVSGEERGVLSIQMLLEYIEKQGVSTATFLQETDRNHQYIEAQIWNDKYLVNHLENPFYYNG